MQTMESKIRYGRAWYALCSILIVLAVFLLLTELFYPIPPQSNNEWGLVRLTIIILELPILITMVVYGTRKHDKAIKQTA